MNRTDQYLLTTQLNHLASLVKCCVLVCKVSGFEFQYGRCHLNFRYRNCFEQGVPSHSDNIECRFTLNCVHDMIKTYSL